MLSVVMKQSQTYAKPVGNSLVAVFNAATPPLVWHFDLDKNHSFALNVQGQDGKWDLGVTLPRGEFTPVARFDERMDADEAFMAVQKAMVKPRIQFSPWQGRLRGALLTAVFILIGIYVLSLVFGGKSSTEVKTSVGSAANAVMAMPNILKPAPMANGVPQSADDVLKMPR